MLTLRRDRLEWWNSDESVFWSGTLKRIIQTKWIVQVSLCCKYRLWPLFANTGTWTVCPWALFFFLLSLFWNLYQWGRATAGGGRDCNLERISHSLIFCLHLWGFETKAPLGFFDCDLFKSAQPQRCNDTLSRCFTVTQLIVLPPCEWKCVAHAGLVACVLYQTSVHQESILFSQTLCNVAKSRVCVCDECVTEKLWLWLRHIHKSQKDWYA